MLVLRVGGADVRAVLDDAAVPRLHFHHPPVAGQVLVNGQQLGLPLFAGRLVDGVEPVGGRLVRPEEPLICAGAKLAQTYVVR